MKKFLCSILVLALCFSLCSSTNVMASPNYYEGNDVQYITYYNSRLAISYDYYYYNGTYYYKNYSVIGWVPYPGSKEYFVMDGWDVHFNDTYLTGALYGWNSIHSDSFQKVNFKIHCRQKNLFIERFEQV